jgi:hypothetical protein
MSNTINVNEVQANLSKFTPYYIQSLSDADKKTDAEKLVKLKTNPKIKSNTLIQKKIDDILSRIKSSKSDPSPACSDQFNQMIMEARKKNSCDSQCLFRKTAAELKIKCIKAKKYESVDEVKAMTACKKYFVYAHGEPAWDKYVDKRLHTKVEKIIAEFMHKIKAETKLIHESIDSYEASFNNKENIKQLYELISKQNIAFKKTIKSDHYDILTSDRKTVYEDQSIDQLKFGYYIILFCYVIVLIVFLLAIFLYPTSMQNSIKFGILVLLVILPFLSTYILSLVIYMLYNLYDVLPKNVNLNLADQSSNSSSSSKLS